jgi:hypothetical protein
MDVLNRNDERVMEKFDTFSELCEHYVDFVFYRLFLFLFLFFFSSAVILNSTPFLSVITTLYMYFSELAFCYRTFSRGLYLVIFGCIVALTLMELL